MKKSIRGAVISCPVCLRQYDAPPAANGKIGHCKRCGARFSIAIAEWRFDGEEVVLFEDQIGPNFAFFRDGCAEFTRNAIALLEMAGHPVSSYAILRILEWIPRDSSDVMEEWWQEGFCNKLLEASFQHFDRSRHEELRDYFNVSLPSRRYDSLDMLEAALQGILAHARFEEVLVDTQQAGAPARVVRRGFIGRWFDKVSGRKEACR